MKIPSVSIIIPVFNKCELTVQCLKALESVTSHLPHEVIVVDNASTDDTPRQLKEFAGRVRVLRNETNAGFAAACNQGAAAAQSKLFLFLNNDTVPLAGWLEPLLEELRLHPNVVAVGSKLLYQNKLVQHAGVAFRRDTRNPFHIHSFLRADDPRVNRRRELQAVTAACVLIRAEWFQKCGRFNEIYRNGYEDLELCLQIRKQGGTIVYQPKSVLFHLESQTPGRKRYDNENRALFFQRWNELILSDEDACYCEDGYRLVERKRDSLTERRLVRLASDEERRQWTIVAQTQRAAAERRWDEMARLLADAEAWPRDAAVRRWAGALCQRRQLSEAARRHFTMARELENNPELCLHLDPDQNAPLVAQASDSLEAEPARDGWSAALAAAFGQLQSGDIASARASFQTALLQGAPPRLVLPGWWEAARQSGAAAEARLTTQALRTMPRLDPSTAAKLELATAAQPAQTGTITAQPGRPPAINSMRTSIIILALNQLEHTRKCLDSLAAHTRSPHEIIFVDNGSTDGTIEFLRQWQAGAPNRLVIQNRTNLGFAAGNNQGLAVASGDIVVLLNNDTVVTEGWLEGMLEVLARHPRTGVVGPMSNYVCGHQLVKEVGYRNLDELPQFAARFAGEHRGQTLEVGRVVGFCLLARRQVIDCIGGLDERFGSGNFEDDDFCIRARLAGFEIRIAQAVFVHHTGSQTFKGARIDYRQAMLRNWGLFKTKWNMPMDQALEQGYRMPVSVPDGVSLKISLPDLAKSHQTEIPAGFWTERVVEKAPLQPISPKANVPPPSAAPSGPPAVASLGRLNEAKSFFGHKQYRAAWEAATAALAARPFHPEAWLLLAEIAQAVGDAAQAKTCVQQAKRLAPAWKAPQKFLKSLAPQKAPPREQLPLPPLRPLADAPQLTVCVIAKNEEKFLGQCLDSVRKFASQIIVVDTGSTDRTVEIARARGAEVYHHSWTDDFSAARNAALERATGDWVLILDADEELGDSASLLKELQSAAVLAYRLPISDAGKEAEGCSYVPRLFRNVPGAHFTGRIHEQLFPSLEARRKEWGLENRLGTTTLRHHGYTAELTRDRNKIDRNLRLLELALQERPGDPNLMMNRALELARSGREVEAMAQYEAAFQQLSASPAGQIVPELRETLLSQYCTRLIAAKQFAEIVRVLGTPLATGQGGLTASLHFMLGLANLELGRFPAAAEQMQSCLAKRRQRSLCPIHQDITTAAPHHCLAQCLARMGNVAAAEKAFQDGLKETGHTDRLRLDYARFLSEHDRPVEALQHLHELVGQNAQDHAAWRLGGQIALSRPEFIEFARDWTGEAIRYLPENPAIIAQRAELLLLSQETAVARELWQRAWRSERQPRALAALVLCEVAAGTPSHGAWNTEDPAAANRTFVEWYRQCIAAGAADLVLQINTRLEQLRQALPEAARIIQEVLAEATGPDAPQSAECGVRSAECAPPSDTQLSTLNSQPLQSAECGVRSAECESPSGSQLSTLNPQLPEGQKFLPVAIETDQASGPIMTVGLILAARFDKGYSHSFGPLGLGYLAASVRKELPGVRVVMKERLDELLAEKPDLIGISAQTETYAVAVEYAKTIKAGLNVPVLIGGVHISMLPESMDDSFDVAVIGDGETTLVEFLQSVIAHRGLRYDALKDIRGLYYKVDGTYHRTPPRELVKNLDLLAPPVMEELPFYQKSEMVCVVSSRGCPYHCTFCISEKFAQRYRCLSAERVANDIEELATKKGVKHIVFYDDLLIANKKRLVALIAALREKNLLGKITFSCAVRANLVNEEICGLLKELGVKDMGMGVETFSDRILQYYNKSGVTGETNQRAIDLLHAAGMIVNPSIIFAAPIETKEDMLITLRKIFTNLRDGKIANPTWATLIPYPGTKIWDHAAQRGLVNAHMDWNDYCNAHAKLYLCEEVSPPEFGELMDEWLVKISLLLKREPHRGGSFVIRNDLELLHKIEVLYPKIAAREVRELGDELVLEFGPPPAGVGYARFLFEHGHAVEALQRLYQAVMQNSQDTAAWHLGAQIALSQPEFLEFARDWTGEAIRYLPEDSLVAVWRAKALLLSGETAAARELWQGVWERDPQPRALAALLLCELVEGAVSHQPRNEAETAETSRAFLDWYRQCLAAGANDLVLQLNAVLEPLRQVLPEAARLLEAALATAEAPELAETCAC